MDNFKLTIEIDGESARRLLAVGPNDLKDYFLTAYLDVEPEDVVAIKFVEQFPVERMLFEKRLAHNDNYFRDKAKE